MIQQLTELTELTEDSSVQIQTSVTFYGHNCTLYVADLVLKSELSETVTIIGRSKDVRVCRYNTSGSDLDKKRTSNNLDYL